MFGGGMVWEGFVEFGGGLGGVVAGAWVGIGRARRGDGVCGRS